MPVYALNDLVPTLPPAGRYWVAPDAHVIGNVTLGEDVGVWFGAVIRADNEPMAIGARSNVQEAALLHSDRGSPLTVGEEVTVGHHAILHGCTVGDCTLIGMGATVLNRARIGRFSILGAGALVTEGKEFPDYSLIVGSPAKVVRELPPSVAEQLRASATHYVANWQRFAAGLRLIG
ncbi:gamma carbonic anhydrase family protein [Paracraurococcus lichenis]|uniref:Gamma carbonic anhydrase family protein n=1 Tax=Paracraurococcus lichenis TaxID=3064888 RepID=A0ABT9E370_9PROT|nr:gamma carbonic anhydrase family protein [Paracraurococcus sp. LOR1-02]MDO9710608.1 gamma carbonic anhydrase family protein [Paracraurococcus sp. LOR1-02]